jgi:hypothetical protein
MMRWRFAIVIAAVLVLPALVVIAPIAAQNQFPANALIRGENIRVRAEPARDAANNAILQRGDAIILTGPLETHPDGEFYPVQVPGTGATGWILALFIDPASIAPGVVTEVVVQPTAAPAAEPNVQVVVEQPTQVVVEAQPTAAPVAEATPAARAGRRNRDRANPRETQPPATPETSPEKVVVSGEGATTSDPVTLVAGKYRVSAAMTVETATGFSAVLNGPNQFSETLFDETIDTPQDWTAETNLRVAETGDYTVTVSNANASWKIRFVPA